MDNRLRFQAGETLLLLVIGSYVVGFRLLLQYVAIRASVFKIKSNAFWTL